MLRRTLLKTGIIGSGLLLLGTGGWIVLRQPLGPLRQAVLKAAAAALLEGAEPPPETSREQMIADLIGDCETAIAGLSLNAQAELEQLFRLLGSTPGRRLSGMAVPWEQASTIESAQWLEGLRHHRLDLMQSAYHALHDIALGAFYGNPRHWHALGYQGPLAL